MDIWKDSEYAPSSQMAGLQKFCVNCILYSRYSEYVLGSQDTKVLHVLGILIC